MLRVLARMLTGRSAVTQGAGADVSGYTVRDMKGDEVPLAHYKGKALLIVNVASRCGMTPQYKDLEELHRRYKDRGFAVLAFPCNDFGGQEPGTNEEIQTFCTTKYDVSFDLFDKITVKGAERPPLYDALTGPENGPFAGEIGWNFTKFLVGKDGRVCARFEPNVSPSDAKAVAAIEAALE